MPVSNATYMFDSIDILASFPPGSGRPPVLFAQPDVFLALLELMIHWTAYFVACASVTIALLVCMTVILFSCACVLEMVLQSVADAFRIDKFDARDAKL